MSSPALRPLARLAAAALPLAMAACAPAPIYPRTAGTLDTPPAQVAQAPERYGDRDVIWGGRVVQVQNFADHSEVEVLAYPLDKSQRPRTGDTSSGRFIAVLPGYVEPLNYPAGVPMTVAGRISGSRAGKVGDAAYVFPLVAVANSHVWTQQELRSGHPNISFGLGVGVAR